MAYPKCFKLSLLVFTIGLFMSEVSLCQCTNIKLNPSTNVEASAFNDTVVISEENYAGDYFIIEKLSIGETFIFSSSNVADYITIRDKDGLTLLDHGPTPLSYTINGADIVSVHINLASPACGTEADHRTTFAVCTTCPPIPPKVEVGSRLEVSGVITVGDIAEPPMEGMIRWNDIANDFEGYDGEKWRSLTRKKAWGTTPIFDRNENQKVEELEGTPSGTFGYSVSISGDYAIVGARYDDVGANTNQGSAYIFMRNGTTWTQQIKLTASDGSASDFFGSSVCISGDYAIVGALSADLGANTNQGAAYIFIKNGTMWTQQIKLTASDGDIWDNFGISVSISGDYAIVGAWGDDVGANLNQGSAYTFMRNGTTWTEQAKLTASDGDDGDSFGISVSISEEYTIVGASFQDVGANINQGSVYIFKRNSTIWTQQVKLTDGDGGDFFGGSVSLSGDYAIVGAWGVNEGANTDQGSAYIYKRNGTTWTQQVKLTASDGNDGDSFGLSVSLSGDYAIVGAWAVDVGANTDQGSAYLFARDGSIWTQQVKLTASDGSASDQFGQSVAIFGDYVIIGAPYDDVGANTDQGSAYFFNK